MHNFPSYRLLTCIQQHWPALLCSLVFLLFLRPVFNSSFILSDDHEIVRLASGEMTFQRALDEDQIKGRFRPFYWIERYTVSRIFTDDIRDWHILNYGLAIVSYGLFYYVLQKISVPRGLASVIAIYVFTNQMFIDSWLALGPQEPLGIFLLLLTCLWAMVTKTSRQHTLTMFLLLLSLAFTKESFIFLLPFPIFLRTWFVYDNSWKLAWQKDRVLLESTIGIMVGTIVLSTWLAYSAGLYSNGGTVLETYVLHQNQLATNVARFIDYLFGQSQLDRIMLWFFIFYCATALLFVKKTWRQIRIAKPRFLLRHLNWLVILTITAALQIGIYAGRSYVSNHYPAPLLIIGCICVGYLCVLLFKPYPGWLKLGLVVIVGWFLIKGNLLKNSVIYSYSYLDNSNRIATFLQFAKDHPHSRVVIAGHSAQAVEQMYSLTLFLKKAGFRRDQLYFFPTGSINGNQSTNFEYLLFNAEEYFTNKPLTSINGFLFHPRTETIVILLDQRIELNQQPNLLLNPGDLPTQKLDLNTLKKPDIVWQLFTLHNTDFYEWPNLDAFYFK